ncbi:MAG: ester cyclase [Bacteroidetes bacterium]|nr:ester cyclase [Bacteroidota bacterium]
MSTEESRSILRRFAEELWLKKNFDIVDELMAEDAINHNIIPGFPQGREGTKAFTAMFQAAFPNMDMKFHEIIADGNLAALRWTASGRHEAELMGVEASGNSVAMSGMGFYLIEDGMIKEVWGETDMMGLMQQINEVKTQG